MALTYLMKARMMSTRKVAARMISVFSSRPRLPNDALRLSKPSSSWGRSKIALKNSQIGTIFWGVFFKGQLNSESIDEDIVRISALKVFIPSKELPYY